MTFIAMELSMDDVIINKVAAIERCLSRIKEESEKDWKSSFTYQDALILNLERACQACIDLAAHVVRKEKLGIPKTTREVFGMLKDSSFVSEDMSTKLQRMVGFRNLAVHDYGNLNLEIVSSIVSNDLAVFRDFSKVMLKYGQN